MTKPDRLGPVEVAIVVLSLALGVVVPLLLDVSVGTVVTTVAAALVVGAAVGAGGSAVRGIGFLVAILGGIAVGEMLLDQPDAWNLSWCLGVVAGLVLGSVAVAARARRQATDSRG